jgi:hypothetical protein
MAEFAPMMSAENPYMRGHAELGGRLDDAAAQQQKLDEQRRQKEFSDELEIRKAGGVPWEPPAMPPDEEDPTGWLKKNTPANLIVAPNGKRYALPDKTQPTAAQQATQAHQGTEDLLTMLNRGGQPVAPNGTVNQNTDIPRTAVNASGQEDPGARIGPPSGINVPVPDQSRVVAAGGKQLYMPTEGEKSQQESRIKARDAGNKEEAEGWVLPDSVARHYAKTAGIPETDIVGKKVPHSVVEDAFKKAADTKTPKFAYSHFTDHEGRVNVTRIGDDGIPQKWDGRQWATMGANERIGPKRKDPDAPAASKANPAQLRLITEKKASALREAEKKYSAAVGPAGLAITPEDKQGAAGELAKDKQAAQDEYEESLAALGYPTQHFSYGSQNVQPNAATPPATAGKTGPAAPSAAPPAGPPQRAQQTPGPAAMSQRFGLNPAQANDANQLMNQPVEAPRSPATPSTKPAQQPPVTANNGQSKTTNYDQVLSYARARGISPAAALRKAMEEGYTVSRPKQPKRAGAGGGQ